MSIIQHIALERTVSLEIASILVLVAVFLVATLLSVHMGALALMATFLFGTFVLGEDVDTLLSGFPADLFLILVGVTYLFALAKDNGTVDWMVHALVRAVAGRVALIPWVFFVVTGILTGFGAVVPAAVAIIAPMGMGFARKYGIRPLLMGLMVINGATAGGFSPLSIFGTITNQVVERNDLPGSPVLLFLASMAFNIVLGIVCFFLFGGRALIGQRDRGHGLESANAELTESDAQVPSNGSEPGAGKPVVPRSDPGRRAARRSMQTTMVKDDDADEAVTKLDGIRIVTLVGLVVLAVMVVPPLNQDVGFTAICIAVIISLFSPKVSKGAVSKIAWPTVLLICGIVTYVELMQRLGTIDWLGGQVAELGAPLVAALLICAIGAVVSAFASTTGILGALIPLAVPFLLTGSVGEIGMIIALAISSSVVDSSPFSTSGALVVANSPEEHRDKVFKQLMVWGFSMVVIAPVVTWLLFVVPGWG
ncbi:UIT1 family transporter [Brevibacterium sanguinis]|uniref:UIT1 family transporter n=2 Tax=Brevibacterium TaxID=1696 RepID=A0A366IJA5_9MICO|nr:MULTISPECIES: SLC13 family permease [Brevibacterium]RBP62024.1 UIT1 family transporter [Brevibacterium sanguinis]RBP70554.1 UIT1 family transporter [Brevibacterium celere]